ncbi:MAG: DNA glycosylase [Lachnospiraceae bacterium]|nr:DNA glycosylase [Lachnospiraceae bacterium]
MAGVIIEIKDDFEPGQIADSGQCFRWVRADEDSYRLIAENMCMYMTPLKGRRYEVDCTEEEYGSFWSNYFDLSLSYAEVRARIDRESDPFLYEASEHEQGIRILRQDPFEMLITFIISQNRNIPAIRRSVELLAERCGEKLTDRRGLTYYAFPTPDAIAALTEDDLTECKLGYRCRYVHSAAESVLSGAIDLSSLLEADEERTIKELTGLLGVGVKVANCVSLFGLHHVDAFPIDVWMKRILAAEYPDGYPYDRYKPYNGIYQQYMFAWYRHRG